MKITIDKLNLKEKIGQLLACGFESDTTIQEIRKAIEDYGAGWIRYASDAYSSSPSEIAQFTNHLQTMAGKTRRGIPLFISLDQAGGNWSNLNRGGITVTPSPMGIGATGSPECSYKANIIVAREMKAVGINITQSPTLNILDKKSIRMTILGGTYSYGDSAELVIKLAKPALEVERDAGIVSIATHFPGGGLASAGGDPHYGLPVADRSLKEIEEAIKPFSVFIRAGLLDMIMTAHICVPALDPTPDTPATLSKKILTGLLREKLGFKGVIVTDALIMKAITSHYTIGEAAVRAIEAGVDVLLLRGSFHEVFEQAYKAVWKAVEKGELTEKRIDESVERVLRLKQKIGLFANPLVDLKKVQTIVGKKEHRQANKQICKRAVTLVKDKNNLIPLKLSYLDKISVITPEISGLSVGRDPIQNNEMLFWEIKKFHPNTERFIWSLRGGPHEEKCLKKIIKQAKELVKSSRLLIVGTYDACVYKKQLQLTMVRELVSLGKPAILVPEFCTRFVLFVPLRVF